jgi:2'-5' RNA ligase
MCGAIEGEADLWRHMSVLRCFLALEPPVLLQDAVEAALMELRDRLGSDLVRWVPGHSVHLTLKFLGDTATSSLDMIKASIEVAAAQFEPFEVALGGFGTFPSSRKPRVLWVGLAGPRDLVSLHREIDLATVRLGYTSEGRAFSPHLTVGRIRQNIAATDAQRLRGELARTKIGEIGRWTVDAVHLFRSDLLPAGSLYTKLFSAALAVA